LASEKSRWLCGALVSVLLAIACEPDSQQAAAEPSPPDDGIMGQGKLPFGSECSSSRECLDGECQAFEGQSNLAQDNVCDTSACRGLCTQTCESDADCTENTRCSTTSRGVMCLPRCEKNIDCPAYLTCAKAGSEGVCWDPNQPGGELKFRTELSIGSSVLDDEYTPGNGDTEFNAGVWRLVPGFPANLTLGVANTGGGGGVFSAAVRAENEWIEVTYSQTSLTLAPIKWYGVGPAPLSGYTGRTLIVAREGTPIQTPLAMSLVLVKENGLEEITLPFNLTSFGSALELEVTSVNVGKMSDYTLNLNDPGYYVEVWGSAFGYGGALFEHVRMVSGATEIEVPEQIWSRFYNAQASDGPFFGAPDAWLSGGSHGQLFGIMAIDALPTGPVTVEVSERAAQTWQTTLAVTVY
jgi:hypothetical protein